MLSPRSPDLPDPVHVQESACSSGSHTHGSSLPASGAQVSVRFPVRSGQHHSVRSANLLSVRWNHRLAQQPDPPPPDDPGQGFPPALPGFRRIRSSGCLRLGRFPCRLAQLPDPLLPDGPMQGFQQVLRSLLFHSHQKRVFRMSIASIPQFPPPYMLLLLFQLLSELLLYCEE